MARRLAAYLVKLIRPDSTIDDEKRYHPNERGFEQARAQWEKWYGEYGQSGYVVVREAVWEGEFA